VLTNNNTQVRKYNITSFVCPLLPDASLVVYTSLVFLLRHSVLAIGSVEGLYDLAATGDGGVDAVDSNSFSTCAT
jgi:hypothetical protein